MNLIDDFLKRAGEHPDRLALIDRSGKTITYGGLERRSARLAAAFAGRGIGKGDRVLVAVWPGIALYAGLAALWRLGAVVEFPEPAMGIAGFRHAAKVTTPKALLAGVAVQALAMAWPETRRIPIGLSPALDAASGGRLAEVADADPALISFTSGSTGAPKAIERSHGLMRAQHTALASIVAPRECGDIDLVAFPAFVLTCLGHGITAAMPDWNLKRHDRVSRSALLKRIASTGATRLLVPPVIVATLADGRLPASVHRVMTGGGPLYPDVARRFLHHAPGVGLTVVYGSTEAEPIAFAEVDGFDEATWNAAASGGGLPVGRPVREVDLRFVDGEIVVAGPHVNRGYLDPSRDRETKIIDGTTVWHRTGDAGRLDAEDRLWLLGRQTSVSGGLRPFAIETAARMWPGVTAAAFAAIDDTPVLFLAGDASRMGDWRDRARAFGEVEIVHLPAIPMDRRHRSKVDVRRLHKLYARI